jgi:hypothetical protein
MSDTGVSLSERERRIGRNEALFREVNERMKDIHKEWGLTEVMAIVCECGDLSCTEQLTIAAARYEDVRSDATWFAVIPGHDVATVEHIIASHSGYDIVQKRPREAALIAEQTAPRD